MTVHLNGRVLTAHVKQQGYKWNTACLNYPILHRLTPLPGSDVRLNLMVKLEQKNYEPTEDIIQLNSVNTVCLRSEWCFSVFTGLAHKYLWSVSGGGGRAKRCDFRPGNSQPGAREPRRESGPHSLKCPCSRWIWGWSSFTVCNSPQMLQLSPGP